MPTQSYIELLVNGKSLRALGPRMERLEADLRMGMPSALTATWRGSSDDLTMKIGEQIQMRVTGEDGTTTVVFEGTITGQEVGYTGRGTTVSVVAQDGLYALARGFHSSTWINSSPTDAVANVLSLNGLRKEVTKLPTVHDIIVQHDETDLEFVRRVGGEIGYALWCTEGTARFSPIRTEGAAIDFGPDDFIRLDVGHDVGQMVANVEVHYWDAPTKRAIQQRGSIKKPRHVDRAFGTAKHQVFGWAVPDGAAAKDKVNGMTSMIGHAYTTMQAAMPGDGRVRVGAILKLDKIDDVVDGRYFVSRARHRYDPTNGYEMDVDCAPHRELALGGDPRRADRGMAGRGAVSAVVSSIRDPEQQGRAEITLEWVDEPLSIWARVAMPGAGAKRGLNLMPEVNDEVFVVFEQGDLRRPVIVGGAYNGKDKSATVTTKGEEVTARTWFSRTGHHIVLDDAAKGGVTVSTGDGKNQVHLAESKGAITITADRGGITLQSQTGDVTIKGKNVKIEATANATLEAKAQLKMTGMAGGELSSPAIMQVKGSLLKLN